MFYKRDIFSDFYKHLLEKEITVLLGPRQAGKTTLLKVAKDKLIKQGVTPENIFYFNLDLVTDRQNFRDQPEFIRFIKQRVGKKRIFLFIDEAQRVDNCGLFFKGVYDLELNIKLVLTGSSSLDLKSKLHESLAGRKKIFHLLPFSFEEYLKTQTRLNLKNFPDFSKSDKQSIWEIFESYLLFGGYPKLIKKPMEKKIDYLTDLFNSYVEKDIVSFLKIRQVDGFIRLVRLLGSQIGQTINIQELSSTLAIDRKTIEAYLLYLEQTFVTKRIRPFFKNYRKELTKLPRIFFYDLGLRNFSLENFKSFNKRTDKGQLLENFILQVLASLKRRKIYFWRTVDGNEVDFVLQRLDGEIIPVEIKSARLSKPAIGRGYRHFLSFYRPKKAFLVNLGLRKVVSLGKTKVVFCLPFELKRELE